MSIFDLFRPRDFTKNENWRNADEWYKQFNPKKEDADYKRVLDFATSRYDEMKKAHEDLDKKAEWCFALAIATTGGLIAYRDKLEMTLNWCAPSLVFLLGAMWFALRTKLPGPSAAPFAVSGGIERTENTEHFDAWLCASLHCATIGMEVVNAWKARQLQAAGRLIVVGIFVLCVMACVSRII